VKISDMSTGEEIPEFPAPQLGEHTREVMIKMLGYTEQEADDYINKFQCPDNL
jgi:hypothetical protein